MMQYIFSITKGLYSDTVLSMQGAMKYLLD